MRPGGHATSRAFRTVFSLVRKHTNSEKSVEIGGKSARNRSTENPRAKSDPAAKIRAKSAPGGTRSHAFNGRHSLWSKTHEFREIRRKFRAKSAPGGTRSHIQTGRCSLWSKTHEIPRNRSKSAENLTGIGATASRPQHTSGQLHNMHIIYCTPSGMRARNPNWNADPYRRPEADCNLNELHMRALRSRTACAKTHTEMQLMGGLLVWPLGHCSNFHTRPVGHRRTSCHANEVQNHCAVTAGVQMPVARPWCKMHIGAKCADVEMGVWAVCGKSGHAVQIDSGMCKSGQNQGRNVMCKMRMPENRGEVCLLPRPILGGAGGCREVRGSAEKCPESKVRSPILTPK